MGRKAKKQKKKKIKQGVMKKKVGGEISDASINLNRFFSLLVYLGLIDYTWLLCFSTEKNDDYFPATAKKCNEYMYEVD